MRIDHSCRAKGYHAPKFGRENFPGYPPNRKIRQSFLPQNFPAIQYHIFLRSVSSVCFFSLQQDDAAGIQGGDAGGDPYCQSHSEGLGPEDTGVRGGCEVEG